MKVSLVAAITVDGFIGKNSLHLSTKWTSQEDGKYFAEFSKRVGHLVVGSATFKTFNRKLGDRKFYVYSRSSELENPLDNDAELVSESPTELVSRLDEAGIEELMIAGGASIYTQFVNAGVVTDLYLTLEPIVFGSGVKLFSDEVAVQLELNEVRDLSDQTKVLHYKVISQ